ncbi:hypothetical protein [Streptomyces sp. SID13031]|nr:hypothetical protein [Streptomyces sp. SID13031]NEA30111.1 hypothetical protein [Streptomyces sp. SID13031]
MIGEAQELLAAVGRSLARSGSDGWRKLEIRDLRGGLHDFNQRECDQG